MVADGAAAMEETGRLSQVFRRICHWRGFRLSVVDVLYKKNNIGMKMSQLIMRLSMKTQVRKNGMMATTLNKHAKNQWTSVKIMVLN